MFLFRKCGVECMTAGESFELTRPSLTRLRHIIQVCLEDRKRSAEIGGPGGVQNLVDVKVTRNTGHVEHT